LIWFEIDPAMGTAAEFVEALKKSGILMYAAGSQVVRACTHLDVSAAQAERVADAVRTLNCSSAAVRAGD
jgi:threonine aldolase